MKTPIKLTAHPLVTTILLLAVVGIGLKPLLLNAGNNCDCSAATMRVAETSVPTCCQTRSKEAAGNCCSIEAKVDHSSTCNCNPTAPVCECGNCGCSKGNDDRIPLPIVPANITTDVFPAAMICEIRIVDYPSGRDAQRCEFNDSAADSAALSSQETCVLLSRFMC